MSLCIPSKCTIDHKTERITPLAGAAFSGNWKLFHEVYDSRKDWAEDGWLRGDVSSTRILVLDSHAWFSEYMRLKKYKKTLP